VPALSIGSGVDGQEFGLTYCPLSACIIFAFAEPALPSDAFNAVRKPRAAGNLELSGAAGTAWLVTLWRRWSGATFRSKAPTSLKDVGGGGRGGKAAERYSVNEEAISPSLHEWRERLSGWRIRC